MNKDEIKRNIAITMHKIIMGDERLETGIEEFEDTLKDVEEIRDFIEHVLHVIKIYVK